MNEYDLVQIVAPFLDCKRLALSLLVGNDTAWEVYDLLPDPDEVEWELLGIIEEFLSDGSYSPEIAGLYEGNSDRRRYILDMLGTYDDDTAQGLEETFSTLTEFLEGQAKNPGQGGFLLKHLNLTKEQVKHCLAHCAEGDTLTIGQIRLLLEDEEV
ncbi:MAG: hypothetical protein WHV66_00170 [Anaerolineales bacterium]